MPGVSIHVVDVARGVVAAGMRVALLRDERTLADGVVSAQGLLEHPALNERFAAGAYEARFHVGAWYRERGVALPAASSLSSAARNARTTSPT